MPAEPMTGLSSGPASRRVSNGARPPLHGPLLTKEKSHVWEDLGSA